MKPGNLSISNLGLSFPGQNSELFRIDKLALEHGKSLGIYGPSGAGKTTLLHCLAGIERPASGAIHWGDTDICSLSAGARDAWRQQQLGLIFQDFHLVEGLSALDNVLLPASFSGWHASAVLKRHAQELLAQVGIATIKRRAELLSRGERQRVAVARALLFQPAVVLADEPTASLDPANREIIGELLLNLVQQHNATLVVISHETSLLDKLDCCMELSGGTLHERPEPAHV